MRRANDTSPERQAEIDRWRQAHLCGDRNPPITFWPEKLRRRIGVGVLADRRQKEEYL